MGRDSGRGRVRYEALIGDLGTYCFLMVIRARLWGK